MTQPTQIPTGQGQPPAQTATDTKKVVVILIKPSSYDEEGFLYRYARAMLPSNSLAVMYSLTKQALKGIFSAEETSIEVYMLEDGISKHARKLRELLARFPEPGTKLIVGLVGVQTAQFPRACDLIARWQEVGATCVIGGFHVSGSITALYDGIEDKTRPGIPCPREMPSEIQTLMDKGVIVFHGEAEDKWEHALADILRGRPRKLYRGGQPTLDHAPLPHYPQSYYRGSFATRTSTLDTSRGCPYRCKFCTIINVQGRTARTRNPTALVDHVEEICEQRGNAKFFFTDDNFGRNPLWEKILDGLAELRRNGREIMFVIQADLQSCKKPRFLRKLAEAGCAQIFCGVESLSPDALKSAGKPQNRVADYKKIFAKCHENGISVHAGYIIGFPHDTAQTVKEAVEELPRLGIDQASFFMYIYLPGSEDHVRSLAAGQKIDSDFNRYDTFQPMSDHPLMDRKNFFEAYKEAWRQFYRAENMIAALRRCPSAVPRWNLLKNYAWCRWSFAAEQTHPMITGFYRIRDYRDRRPGAKPLPYSRYLLQEGYRHLRYVGYFFAEFYRFQHIVFETEFAPTLEETQREFKNEIQGIGQWVRLTFGKAVSRKWLNSFWKAYGRNRWQLLLNPLKYRWHIQMVPYLVTEAVYTIRFILRLRENKRASTA